MLANSFERIHLANLIGMGVLPLRLPEGWRPATLGLVPGDVIDVALDLATLAPRAPIAVTLRRRDGTVRQGIATALLDTARDAALIRGGGMIPTILRKALGQTLGETA